MNKPSVSQPVHYVLQDGQHRAATVVNTSSGRRVNLTVHLDQVNDVLSNSDSPTTFHAKTHLIPQGASDRYNGTLAVGSADHDADAKAPGTWHYSEIE